MDSNVSKLIIRQAAGDDVHEMAELDKICFSMPWSEASFLHEVTENGLALYIVAELEGKLVGYAGIWLIAGEGHITNVAVHPDYRRRHIGEAIVSALLAEAETAGVFAETLEVRAMNSAAQGLYAKFGFKAAGIRKGYYEDNGEDAVIMWRTAAGSKEI